MQRKLDGKVALITGAGRGIGQAIALKLASEGARIVVNDLDPEHAENTVSEIRAIGGTAMACSGSVTDPEFAPRFINCATEHFGGLDIIVNNAGYNWDSVIQNMSDEQWTAMLDVHLSGPFRILRAAQPVIRALSREEGTARRVRKVVNISSMSGLFGHVGHVNYSTAKAGVVGMTMALAKEWGRLGTTVNCVAYGPIRTRLLLGEGEQESATIEGHEVRLGADPALTSAVAASIPLGYIGDAADAAGAVYLFCIPESDYVSGQTLMCSGGLTGL